MALVPGTKLGPYEIVAVLGAGGMGEVYRAKDTRLGRDVAVKVLPQHLSSNPEIRARFEREAKTVSSLNHPHICTLHDIGRQGDTDYLVMELIEGETLAARLARGALPIADVLKLGAQVADALGRAHRAGVMHRDLKPGNVMLTRSGAKLMDFGLARATGLGQAGEMTSSPTVAGPLTAEGTILGTFQYMAPEQLEGKDADVRADLWALGCVLYEMATGRRAFEGATQASLISAIMRDVPRPMAELAPLSPPALERVVRHCLAKDPEDRIQTAHDVKLQLEGIAEPGSQVSSAAPVSGAAARSDKMSTRERIAWGAIATLVATAGALSWRAFRPVPTVEALRPMRFTVAPPPRTQMTRLAAQASIAPDGKLLAFAASDASGTTSLWVRALDALDAHSLEGTENAFLPFWSPDSRWIAFFAGGKLKKVGVSGGFPEVLCDAPDTRGGSWGRNGDIVFAPRATGGLYRVSPGGGEPVEIFHPDSALKETGLRFPQFLGDGEHFAFVSQPRHEGMFDIHLGSLSSKKREPLMRAGASPVWAAPGYLITSRRRRLVAQRFDLASRKLIGEPLDLGPTPPASGSDGVPVVSASENGILAYSTLRVSDTQASWFDRAGKRQSVLPLAKGFWMGASVSPDGRRVLIGRPESADEGDWWIADADGSASRRFANGVVSALAIWSPDGTRVAIQMNKSGPSDIFVKAVDGGDAEEPLVVSQALFKNPQSWTPDGRFVLFDEPDPKTGWDIWRVPIAGDHTPEPILQTAANERGGWLSPDGRWLAYTSDESGRDELYVRSYPAAGRRLQVSTSGLNPFAYADWSRDGREIVVFDGALRSIAIEADGTTVRASAPRELFPAPASLAIAGFAVTPDHQRFLFIEPVEVPEPEAIEMDLNWAAALPR